MDAIRIERLCKTFNNGRKALDSIDLKVVEGEMVALIGASGSGKSTLLRHIAGFTASDPAPSHVTLLGRPIQENGKVAREVRRIRRDVAFVFQQFNLVGRLTVRTNVLIGALSRVPLWRRLIGRFPRNEHELAMASLSAMGIGDHINERASTLSGGQQQRAALARALVQRARIVLADEPIASLDPESSRRVMELLQSLNEDHGLTVVVSLHQIDIAMKYCARTVALRNGCVVYDGPSASLTPALLRELYGAAAEELLTDADTETDAAQREPVRQTERATARPEGASARSAAFASAASS
ncbi:MULTISPECIES: phosphonate ABC transporter ATP-binding protein [Burkholderiaceae]|jgi:phosphonate transport system ATP-binding protein|uniref:Phosphonate ABC transporter ATP-binding protein n=1 Tax=Caballeronia sordidicola TaxID=196367 RepID=A0A242MEB0_CABSO|nr:MULTISPECIES: phosphonate ABC transporter ATP-binding protein [Burkholderiaceae]AME25474.1 phosphonate ABC transporter ATP-binidng protein [Burkholderia sp. PAMC 26561]MDP9157589.1 phosphonate ABC transporter ATP-binding protein [Pseudomonadota bacterium]OTP69643.1 Phosphonate ABC transporter ATP-binding protein [Caballeronia sordidicola]OTP74727.1 Phosphonate ABC transporter ATP-binding protein [Caballeronia sordidicola]